MEKHLSKTEITKQLKEGLPWGRYGHPTLEFVVGHLSDLPITALEVEADYWALTIQLSRPLTVEEAYTLGLMRLSKPKKIKADQTKLQLWWGLD